MIAALVAFCITPYEKENCADSNDKDATGQVPRRRVPTNEVIGDDYNSNRSPPTPMSPRFSLHQHSSDVVGTSSNHYNKTSTTMSRNAPAPDEKIDDNEDDGDDSTEDDAVATSREDTEDSSPRSDQKLKEISPEDNVSDLSLSLKDQGETITELRAELQRIREENERLRESSSSTSTTSNGSISSSGTLLLSRKQIKHGATQISLDSVASLKVSFSSILSQIKSYVQTVAFPKGAFVYDSEVLHDECQLAVTRRKIVLPKGISFSDFYKYSAPSLEAEFNRIRKNSQQAAKNNLARSKKNKNLI